MHTEHTDTHRPPDAQKDSDEYSIMCVLQQRNYNNYHASSNIF